MEWRRQSVKRKNSSTDDERSTKKQRLLITPPATASLRVVIPHRVLTKDDHRNTKIHQAAALRWIPKLRNPFPKRKEINEAYKLKLMRHYRRSTTTTPEPNFTKPLIDTSSRVTRLLRQFPTAISTSNGQALEAGNPPGTYARPDQITKLRQDAENLQINKRITKSEGARRLAWQSFSSTEKDRIDNGRQALIESGLAVEDLEKEYRGIKNGLPEWKKRYTGKYAKEWKQQQQ